MRGTSVDPNRSAAGGVRLRLLEVAVAQFSARGFDGVTVDEIVAAAGVNKRMVYHYFGSKEGLYRETLGRVFASLQTLEEGVIASHAGRSDPDAAMRRLVFLYFDFLESHGEFVRLLLWENLGEGRHLGEVEQAMSKTPVLGHVETLLREGINQGRFRAGLDARLVLTSLIGLSLVYFSNRFTLSRSVGLDFRKPANLRRAVAHAADVFLSGLRPEASRSAPRKVPAKRKGGR